LKDIILKAENISKQYRLGQVGTGTLSHNHKRWWHQLWIILEFLKTIIKNQNLKFQ